MLMNFSHVFFVVDHANILQDFRKKVLLTWFDRTISCSESLFTTKVQINFYGSCRV